MPSILESFYIDNDQFISYTTEHYIPVIILCLIGIYIIKIADKNWSQDRIFSFGAKVSMFLFIFQVAKVPIRYFAGNLDITQDLPLHLCNYMPLFMYFVFKLRSKWLFGIAFFWIIGGTFQSNITPTLTESFPHYEYFRYWFIHMGLTMLVLYAIICLDWSLRFSEGVKAALALNAAASIMYPINLILGSNYMYLIHKPAGPTVYDLLGPWPWYIFNIELFMAVLFPILTLPFYLIPRLRDNL